MAAYGGDGDAFPIDVEKHAAERQRASSPEPPAGIGRGLTRFLSRLTDDSGEDGGGGGADEEKSDREVEEEVAAAQPGALMRADSLRKVTLRVASGECCTMDHRALFGRSRRCSCATGVIRTAISALHRQAWPKFAQACYFPGSATLYVSIEHVVLTRGGGRRRGSVSGGQRGCASPRHCQGCIDCRLQRLVSRARADVCFRSRRSRGARHYGSPRPRERRRARAAEQQAQLGVRRVVSGLRTRPPPGRRSMDCVRAHPNVPAQRVLPRGGSRVGRAGSLLQLPSAARAHPGAPRPGPQAALCVARRCSFCCTAVRTRARCWC